MTTSGAFQLTNNRKRYIYAFDQCFRQFLDKALQNRKICHKAISKLPITENRIEKLLLVRFLLSKNNSFVLGHIALSHPILKIMT